MDVDSDAGVEVKLSSAVSKATRNRKHGSNY